MTRFSFMFLEFLQCIQGFRRLIPYDEIRRIIVAFCSVFPLLRSVQGCMWSKT